jgi:hypothetical protein
MNKITITGTFAEITYIPRRKTDKGIMFLRRVKRAYNRAKKIDNSLTLKVEIV